RENALSPLDESPSYGGFSNLSNELDERAQSRKTAKAMNAALGATDSSTTEPEAGAGEAKRRHDLRVGDKSVREHGDPLAPKSMDTDAPAAFLPRGDRMNSEDENAELDDRPRAERFRKKLTKNREDALGGVESTVDNVKGLFDRPPTVSHSVTKTDQPI